MPERIIKGLQARALADYITHNFTVGEVTHHRGWWEDDIEGEVARYEYMLRMVAEPARDILGVGLQVISGSRPIGFNEKGRASSMHLPPVQRAAKVYQFLKFPAPQRGAALDVVPMGVPCDEAFRLLDAAQRSGKIPPGGLFWYPPDRQNPGPASGRFIHIDYRPNGLAREADKVPPSR